MEEEGVKSGVQDLGAEYQAATARTLCRQGLLALSDDDASGSRWRESKVGTEIFGR